MGLEERLLMEAVVGLLLKAAGMVVQLRAALGVQVLAETVAHKVADFQELQMEGQGEELGLFGQELHGHSHQLVQVTYNETLY
jgi:hypothetical protein